ncbi:VWA domain-containing protein [Streptomyces sp. WAC 04229]|uniref:vWA domain-containing protein n=1 Tax=Streptomyces sp. WAC 04229 TaxID=2203206 RepID=UPI003D72824E
MLALLTALLTFVPKYQAAAADSLDPPPVDFVVLVDESGSLSAADVAAERAAASILALGEVSERSRAAVAGFGSASGPGQTPVDTVCPMTRADAAGREQLSSCVSALKRRGDAEGNGTDFPAALAQGLSLLDGTDADTPKVMFLLTDGRLDVSDSPAYGNDPTSRNANAQRALERTVAQARAAKVQIWPLGFGDGIDRGQLDAIAKGGYQSRCGDQPSARPRAGLTSDSADVAKVLLTAFAGARCAQTSPSDTDPEVRGEADLEVTIPPVATDGSIAVVKEDPAAVVVTYYDPRGKKVPLRGSAEGSAFELVGQSGPVEALRIRDPYPGTWRVHVEVLDGAKAQRITSTAIWQGVLRTYIVVDPPVPEPGQRVTARVILQTRRGVVLSEPGQLAGITGRVRLTGDGFAPSQTGLRDDGRPPDAKAHDGEFAALLTVPRSAKGKLAFTGVVTGEGIAGDESPYATELASSAPALTGGIVYEDGEVHPGGTAHGTLELRNSGTTARRLRLTLTGGPATGSPTVSPGGVTLAAGASRQVPIRLTFAADAPFGAVPGRLTVRDERSGQTVTEAFLRLRVVPVPSFLDRYGPWAGGLAALLLAVLAVAVLRWRDRLWARDVSDIQLILYIGETELSRLRAPSRAGSQFGFRLRGGDSAARLLLDTTGKGHRVRRSADGGLTVRSADGENLAIPRGGRSPIEGSLLLGFADHRPRVGSRHGPGRPAGPARSVPPQRVRDRRRASGTVRDRKTTDDRSTLTQRRPYDDDF